MRLSSSTEDHAIDGYRLSGKNAIITGASRSIGIGAAIARIFAALGANIYITYYPAYDREMYGAKTTDGRELIAELRALGIKAAGREIDLGAPLAAGVVFDAAESRLGPIDILINNATVDIEADIRTLSPKLLDRHYAVNMRSVALLCQEFAQRYDPSRKSGRIINLTSGQSLHPMPFNLPYAMTKNAAEALTTCLAASLASNGITVNAVDPGATDTGWMTDEVRGKIAAETPMGRIGEPEDAARLIAFLASDQAQWITGQIIRSRGGL